MFKATVTTISICCRGWQKEMQWKNCSLLSTILRKHVTGSDKSLISRLVVSNIRCEETDLNLGICLTEHADLTADFLVNTCFNKFRNIYRKTTASEPLSVKLQTSRHIPMSIMGVRNVSFSKRLIWLGFWKWDCFGQIALCLYTNSVKSFRCLFSILLRS